MNQRFARALDAVAWLTLLLLFVLACAAGILSSYDTSDRRRSS